MKLPEILWIPLTSFGALMRRHFKKDLRKVRSFERRWRKAMKDEEIISRAVSELRFGDSYPHKLSGNDWHNGQIDWTYGTLGYGHRGGPDRSLFRRVELHRPTLMEWLEKHFPTGLPEPAALPEQASTVAIRKAMRRVYDDAERARTKPPNVKEAISATVAVLRSSYHVVRKVVERVADEPEFERRRVPPGEHFTKRRKRT